MRNLSAARWLLAFILAASVESSVFGLPSIVRVSGRQLLVQPRLPDGSLGPAVPYQIRGVNWSPASTTTFTSPTDPNNVVVRRPEFAKWFQTDLPLIRAMNANTVRVPLDFGVEASDGPQGLRVLDACASEGLMVVMTVDNGVNDTGRMQRVVEYYRNHPAILCWSLGNEWNFNRYYSAVSSVREAAERTEAAAAFLKSIDPNHPVVSSYGELDIHQAGLRLADTVDYINDICRHVDVWSFNIYRGRSFGSLFVQWRAISPKPMFLGEFGIDAFHATTPVNPNPPGSLDEPEQAQWDVALWKHLSGNLSAVDREKAAIGGMVHEFNDQWWKIAPPTSQQTGGLISSAFPDGISSEEIFGLCDIFRNPRAAYESLSVAFDPRNVGSGAVWVVTNTDNSGPGSLRQALEDARNGDTIVFDDAVDGTILLFGQLRIEKDVAIQGPGAAKLSLNGRSLNRVFHVLPGVFARISGVEISRGAISEFGGGILNEGVLEVAECTFVNNFAGTSGDGAGQGGGIYSSGALTVLGCEFSGNRATGNGGAIRSSGELAVEKSRFTSSRANYFGGAIYNFSSGVVSECVLSNNTAATAGAIWNEDQTLAVIRTSIVGNTATDGGGLANKNGDLLVVNSTVGANRAAAGGGIYNSVFGEPGGNLWLMNSSVISNLATGTLPGAGVRVPAGSATLRSTLIAGNSLSRGGEGTDCSGSFISGGYNLVGDGSGSAGLNHGLKGDQIGSQGSPIDPRIGELGDYGGPGPTYPLVYGSPALDQGKSFGWERDQRGEPRTDRAELSNAPGGDGADIGAYEASEVRIVAAGAPPPNRFLRFTTILGRSYIVQSRPDLTAGNWSEAGDSVAGTGGVVQVILADGMDSSTFYRIVENP